LAAVEGAAGIVVAVVGLEVAAGLAAVEGAVGIVVAVVGLEVAAVEAVAGLVVVAQGLL
jgi:hypothetical protein